MGLKFNPLGDPFDIVKPNDSTFKPYTHFDCGPVTELDFNWFNKIACGTLPFVSTVRKIDLGELSNVGSD